VAARRFRKISVNHTYAKRVKCGLLLRISSTSPMALLDVLSAPLSTGHKSGGGGGEEDGVGSACT